MSAATFVTRTYTPLAFRETTERWLVAVLATVVAVVWCFVIPLEIVLHEPSRDRRRPHRQARRPAHGWPRRPAHAERRPPDPSHAALQLTFGFHGLSSPLGFFL